MTPASAPRASAEDAPGAGRAGARDAAEVGRSSVGNRELAAWIAVMLLVAGLRVALGGGPRFLNDSYQYLSIAEHLGRDHAIETSIVHFDVERATGRVPAPESTFPPGFAVLARIVSAPGLPTPWAALLVSLAAVVAVLPLLRSAAASLGLSTGATRVVLAAWALSAQAALWGTTLYSDATFTVLAFAVVALLLAAAREPAPARRTGLALLLAGASVWIRYAGVFLLAALHGYALWRVAAAGAGRRRAEARTWVPALAAADLLVAALLVRNAAQTGTAKGGHTAGEALHPLGDVAYRLGAAAYGLVLGSHEKPWTLPFGAFVALTLGGAIAGGVWAARTFPARRRAGLAGTPAQRVLLAAVFSVYVTAFAYLAVTTNVTIEPRMFLPMVPLVLLALAVACSGAPAGLRFPVVAAVALAAGYAGANVASDLGRPEPSRHALVAEMLSVPTPAGEPLSRWIEANVPRDAVLLAVEGQATGYLLRRPTISAVGARFTRSRWNADDVRRTMDRFGAEWLILYPEVVASGGKDALDSAFFRELDAGRTPPWLELAAASARARVYRKVALPAGAAEVVIQHGRIWTGVPAAPWAEAIAVRDGRILRVGSAADVAPLVAPATRAIDLGGRLALPGLIDSHTHPSLEAERPWHWATSLPWSLVRRHERLAAVIRPTPALRAAALATSLDIMSAFGITAFGDAKVEPEVLPVWGSVLRDRGLRQHAVLFIPALEPDGTVRHARDLKDAFGREALPGVTLGAKIFVDGYLEVHTAALVEPYDGGGGSGRLVAPPATLRAIVDDVDAAGLPIQAHAIGDAAVRAALDAFEEAHRRRAGAGGPRDVIVHLNLVHPDDVARFARLGVGASPYPYVAQPAPANDFLVPMLGRARVDRSYLPLARLWDAGAIVGASSDWAAFTMSPFYGMWVGVTRASPQHRERGALGPANAVTLERMVRSYTVENAALLGMERDAGTLEPGKWADLAVLDRDIFARPLDELLQTRVDETIFQGEVVYDGSAGLPDAVARVEAELLELGKAH